MLPLPECFEMESRTSLSSRNRLAKKVIAEEYELRDLPQGTAISCWWMTLPVFYYLAVIAGGVIASISVGDVTAAFDNNCIFFANFTLKGLDALENNTKALSKDNVEIIRWGDMDYCQFPEYTSVACVMYAGILLVMVLQCGRGGGKSAFRGRGIAESWRIVPVAFIFNLIFLILSSIIFGYIQNGFSAFCDGISQKGSSQALGNVSSCSDVLQYSFPWDKYNTNLYMEYTLAKTGASLQLVGSVLAFLTIILRCCLPADFIVYRRRKIEMSPGIQSSCDDERSDSSSGAKGKVAEVTTTVICHNNPGMNPGYSKFENVADDNDSIHSNGSDIQLVSPSSSSNSSKSKSKTRISKSQSKT